MKATTIDSGARRRRIIVNTFIICYITLITLWLMPEKWKWREVVLPTIRPLILFTGLWQNFAVFSPNPRNINLHLDAIVHYEDGTSGVWHYPRMERLPLVERTFEERYRKYGHDHLNWDKERQLWPDFARFVARRMNKYAAKPQEIILKRYWALIPPPEQGLGKPAPEHTNTHLFFRYKVKPEDLQ